MDNLCPACKVARKSATDSTDCWNCGYVYDDAPIVQDARNWTGDAVFTNYREDLSRNARFNRHLYPSIPNGRKLGKKLIERSGRILNCNSQVVDEAKSLYDRAFAHEIFHYRQIKTKLALATACLYITCRQRDYVVTLRDVADVSRCATSDINQCKTEILAVFSIEIKSIDLLQLAEMRCEKAGFGCNIASSTLQVIKLCQKLWIAEGRNPENIFMASSFIAWQGEDSTERLKTTFRAFCKLFKFVYSKQSNIFVGLIRSILCDLAKEIPWVAHQKINPTHIALHFQDILKFQNTLIAEAVASFKNSDSDDSDHENCKEVISGVQNGVSNCGIKQFEKIDMLSTHLNGLESPSISPMKSVTKSSEKVKNNLVQKRPAGPSWLHYNIYRRQKIAKKGKSAAFVEVPIDPLRDLDDDELGNDDIHDEHLHLFVKSEAEVKNELMLARLTHFTGT